MLVAHGPVAQRIEQQPSKLKVAGSNPAGVANLSNGLRAPSPIDPLCQKQAWKDLMVQNAAGSGTIFVVKEEAGRGCRERRFF
jgi:hypothetical protein